MIITESNKGKENKPMESTYHANIIVESSDTNKIQNIIGQFYPIKVTSYKGESFILVNVNEYDETLFDHNTERIIDILEENGIRSYC